MPKDHSQLALIISGIAMVLLIALIALVPGRQVVVARKKGTYTPPKASPDDVQAPVRLVNAGDVIPVDHEQAAKDGGVMPERKRLRALRGIVVGDDNRLSTSKTVAAVWTFAIAFGLLSLLVARWLGDPAGWNVLNGKGLQEEYLLFLGGPYAAAVIAKYQATNDQTRTPATPGSAGAKDLIAKDSGEADLGDFQYVLFNAIALLWYLGELIPHLHGGMPTLPDLLAGLALTSAGGYAAKKLVGQQMPTLTSVRPADAVRDANGAIAAVTVWGTNLIVPTADGTSDLQPTVAAGGFPATVAAVQRTAGGDQLVVTFAETVPDDRPLLVSVTRADGLDAQTPGGAGGLTATVHPHGWSPP
jgi:hypothetical protein